MSRSVTITKARAVDGGIAVQFSNKRGLVFHAKADVQAVLDAFEAAVSDEMLVALAIKKFSALNNPSLADGKTVTLTLDVVAS